MADTEVVIEPGRQDVVFKRVFDAPRELVFKALTDPALVSDWWGPNGFNVVVDHMEARTGGSWRCLNRDADGNEYAFRGVFHEVAEPARIVQTFEFEGAPGNASLETITLADADGKTQYMSHTVFQSVQARDAMVSQGMAEGASDAMDKLAAVIQRLR